MKRTILTLLVGGLMGVSAHAATFYSTLPGSLPPIDSQYSWGYAATSSTQFGDYIRLNPLLDLNTDKLNSATVMLSNWAYRSLYDPTFTNSDPNGYWANITLSLYDVAGDAPGTLIAGGSSTTSVFIPWRAEPTPSSCPGGVGVDDPGAFGNPYFDGSNCYSGNAMYAQFAFNSVTLSSDLIYSLSVATGGAANSLNFGFSAVAPSVGSNPYPDTGYHNSSEGYWYTDGGTGGTGTFRKDTGFNLIGVCGENTGCVTGSLSGAIELSTDSVVPEPGTVSMFLIGLAGIAVGSFRKTALAKIRQK